MLKEALSQSIEDRHLIVDAGDLLSPLPRVSSMDREAREVNAELLIETLAASGMDAMTVGAGDFAFGVDFLVGNASAWGLPYVCANLAREDTGALLFPPSVSKEVAGVKVGLFGLTGEILQVPGLKVLEPVAAARDTVAALKREGAQFIVALSNQRLEANERLARKVPDIDLIVAGSTRRRVDPPEIWENTLMVEPGNKGKYLGTLEITLHEGAGGWADLDAHLRVEERTERFRRRSKVLERRLRATANPREIRRLERQLELLQEESAKAYSLEPVGKDRRTFVNRLEALGPHIADDPEVAVRIKAALARVVSGSAVPR